MQQSTAKVVAKHYSFVRQWESSGSGDGQFNFTEGIAVDSSGNVYVADYGNNRIQVFSPSS
jgi:tripartite motif-containing protein 71